MYTLPVKGHCSTHRKEERADELHTVRGPGEGCVKGRRKEGAGREGEGGEEHYLIPFTCSPKAVSLQTAVARGGGREGGRVAAWQGLGVCVCAVL